VLYNRLAVTVGLYWYNNRDNVGGDCDLHQTTCRKGQKVKYEIHSVSCCGFT